LIEAIKYGKQIQNQIQIAYALLGFANIASVQEDYPIAGMLYAFLQSVDTISDDYLRRQIDNALSFVAEQLPPDHFAEVTESGKAISSEQAVDIVLPQGIRALIIDNNSGDAMMLEQLLEIEGITAIRAMSPEDALEKILQLSHVGIIFLDIGMAENTENWLTSELTKDPRTRNIPIVAYTGSSQSRRAQRAGFDKFITKPIDIGGFAMKLRQIMDD